MSVEIPGFHGELLPFQVEDVAKLISVPAGLNCNEMGCGKTIEAVAMDTIYRNHNGGGQTLVIAPLATIDDAWDRWYSELTDAKVVVVDPKNREKAWNNFTNRNADVFITHWQSLLKMPELASFKWSHVIADEVQQIQNRKKKVDLKELDEATGEKIKVGERYTTTGRFKLIYAPRKLAMSGTPLDELPDRLWSVLNWLYPQRYTAYWKFYHKYVDSEVNWFGYREAKGIKKHMLPTLHAELGEFFVRHLKKDVVPEMPDKYWTVLTAPLTTPQQRQYKSMAKDMLAIVNDGEHVLASDLAVSQWTRLTQIANATLAVNGDDTVTLIEPSNKIDTLVNDILKVINGQVIVFTVGTKFLDLVEKRMQKEKITYVRYDGSTPREARNQAIANFQAGKAQVFLGTIQAAGTGITLTAASTVVFLERHPREPFNQQAEDRAWRIGQNNAVQIIDIRSRGTVDAKRANRLVTKAEWIRETLGDSA